MSTALEKSISQNSAVKVLHEPFTNDYYFSTVRRSSRYSDACTGFNPHELSGEDAIFANLCHAGFLVVKELAFQGEPFISDTLLQNSDHVLLTRHPSLVYDSLVRIKPDFTEDEFGYLALHRIVRRLEKIGKLPVLALDGTDLQANPELVVAGVCKILGIPFEKKMLGWEDGRVRKWSADEELSQRRWHGTLEQSKGFIKPPVRKRVAIQSCHEHYMRSAETIYDSLIREYGRPGMEIA